MFDVSLRYGMLHMPAFVLDEGANVLLTNLVAFKHGGCRAARYLDVGNLVTGFVDLVGWLVNSRRDLEEDGDWVTYSLAPPAREIGRG
uniref:Uncharacterized protein n=1 Tax=Saccharum hybrid cultivar R570 TaxID=131158 RepID=A0A059PZT8_9POAL|nr:hypothetical protein SHCRBa_011_K15_F_20 [Saccharum hybrid cultivar R570]